MPEYTLDTTLAPETWRDLDEFTRGYITCAMWTLTDDDGHSLDYLGLHDIAAQTIETTIADCRQFQTAYSQLLALTGADTFRNGADYFLTRNGHGAGFWDRGYPSDLGDALTHAAHADGSDDWYVGDDGEVYRG